jgi:SAM-dependent methyltransferase
LPPNHKYLINRIRSFGVGKGRVLDYGCGKGTLVEEGRRIGWSVYGCELFAAGSGVAIRDELERKGLLGKSVYEIKDQKIPFPDGHFNCVVTNQVLEHVPDLDATLAEISRVLSPSGRALSVFPTRECIRDHAGTFFAHWFPERSKSQYFSLLLFRTLGFGRLKKGRGTPRQWAEFFSHWLAENTWYRSLKDVDSAFQRHFESVAHIEEDYMRFRLEAKGIRKVAGFSETAVGAAILRRICIRWGGVAIVAENPLARDGA